MATMLARDVHEAVSRWSRFDQWSVGVQLVRAADSIGANIAESAGRWHERDKRQLLFVARGSLYETEHFIETAITRGLMPPDAAEPVTELAKTLNGLIKRWTPT
jgi:four helix bundle protein